MSDPYIPQQQAPVAAVTGKQLTYAASMSIDLGGPAIQEVTLGGNLTLAARGHSAGQKVDLIIRADGSTRNLAFDADWVFVGTKPTTIAASKTGRLTLLTTNNLDTKVVAQYAVQA